MLFLFPNLVAETYALTVALFFAANRVISFKFIGQGKLVEVASFKFDSDFGLYCSISLSVLYQVSGSSLFGICYF